MTIIAQEIMAEVENLPMEKQQEVLKFVKALQPAQTEATIKVEPARSRQTIEGLWADLDINITDEGYTRVAA